MKVALFIPGHVDAFYPEPGIATLELLERRRASRPNRCCRRGTTRSSWSSPSTTF